MYNPEQAKRLAHLSELSRRVLHAADQIAARSGHKQVGLAHFLLALARERRSICARLLYEHHLNIIALEANLTTAHPMVGGSLESMIEHAAEHARRSGSHYTGTEHLLMSLILDRRGARLLRHYGTDPQALLQQMPDQLS